VDDIDDYIAQQEAERKKYEQGEGMSDIDTLIEKARERNEETEKKLKSIEEEQQERLAQDEERRERLAKGIGEHFTGKKDKVLLEMEKDLEEKRDAEMLRKRQEIASSLGLKVEELETYLNLRGEKND